MERPSSGIGLFQLMKDGRVLEDVFAKAPLHFEMAEKAAAEREPGAPLHRPPHCQRHFLAPNTAGERSLSNLDEPRNRAPSVSLELQAK